MAATFDITGQREVVDLSGPDGAQRAMEVTFRTKPSQVTASVRIPLADYSPVAVQRAVEQYAAQIEETHQL